MKLAKYTDSRQLHTLPLCLDSNTQLFRNTDIIQSIDFPGLTTCICLHLQKFPRHTSIDTVNEWLRTTLCCDRRWRCRCSVVFVDENRNLKYTAQQLNTWYLILDVDGLSKLSLINAPLCTWIQAVLEAVHRTSRDNMLRKTVPVLDSTLTKEVWPDIDSTSFDSKWIWMSTQIIITLSHIKQVLLWNLFTIGQNLECLDQVTCDAPLFKGCQAKFLQSCVVIKLLEPFY